MALNIVIVTTGRTQSPSIVIVKHLVCFDSSKVVDVITRKIVISRLRLQQMPHLCLNHHGVRKRLHPALFFSIISKKNCQSNGNDWDVSYEV